MERLDGYFDTKKFLLCVSVRELQLWRAVADDMQTGVSTLIRDAMALYLRSMSQEYLLSVAPTETVRRFVEEAL